MYFLKTSPHMPRRSTAAPCVRECCMTWTWGIRDFGATQSRVERELVLVNPFPIGRTLNFNATMRLLRVQRYRRKYYEK